VPTAEDGQPMPARSAPGATTRPVPVDPYAERARAEKPTHAEGKPPERYRAGTRRRSSTVEPPPRAVRPPPATAPTKPAHQVKRSEDDPDGTLPPSD
jgi:hypothetical protein